MQCINLVVFAEVKQDKACTRSEVAQTLVYTAEAYTCWNHKIAFFKLKSYNDTLLKHTDANVIITNSNLFKTRLQRLCFDSLKFAFIALKNEQFRRLGNYD